MEELVKGVILCSGGLDSTTLCYLFRKKNIDFIPLIINYGQHCFQTELNRLLEVLPNQYVNKIKIIDVSDIYAQSSSKFIKPINLWEEKITADDLYIPYRNVLLLTIGASYALTIGLDHVYAAFINSNHAKEIDCSEDFFNKLENLLTEFGSVKIVMPFKNLSKFDVVKLALEIGTPIGKTYSCQASPEIPCGACPNCVDRLEALRKIIQ